MPRARRAASTPRCRPAPRGSGAYNLQNLLGPMLDAVLGLDLQASTLAHQIAHLFVLKQAAQPILQLLEILVEKAVASWLKEKLRHPIKRIEVGEQRPTHCHRLHDPLIWPVVLLPPVEEHPTPRHRLPRCRPPVRVSVARHLAYVVRPAVRLADAHEVVRPR